MQAQKGRADRKAKTAKPAEQERTYPINRHEKPDCADGNDGGGKIVPKQEKLFAKPVQQTVQGRLRIKEGAEERQREQDFPQPCAAVYNVADFLREHPVKSIPQEMIFSNTASTVENAAKDIKTKNKLPQSLPSGI